MPYHATKCHHSSYRPPQHPQKEVTSQLHSSPWWLNLSHGHQKIWIELISTYNFAEILLCLQKTYCVISWSIRMYIFREWQIQMAQWPPGPHIDKVAWLREVLRGDKAEVGKQGKSFCSHLYLLATPSILKDSREFGLAGNFLLEIRLCSPLYF